MSGADHTHSTAFMDELDTLAASSLSESYTPHLKGDSLISELTSSHITPSSKRGDKESTSLNVGALLSSVSKTIVEEDNKEYGIVCVRDLVKGNLSALCCQRRSGGKNTFCTIINCTIDHRNENTEEVKVHLNSIIVMRTKNAAFVSPIGSLEIITNDVLEEWKTQNATLSEWSDRFFLAASNEESISSIKDLQSLKSFGEKAALHKTPSKPPKVQLGLNEFTPHDKKKFIKGMTNLKDDGFGMSAIEYFSRIDQQFDNVSKAMKKITQEVNLTSEEVFSALRMLQFEKNKLKSEIGNREKIIIHQDFDASSLWEVASMMSFFLKDEAKDSPTTKESSTPKYLPPSFGDDSLAKVIMEEADKTFSKLKQENKDLKQEVILLNHRFSQMETRMTECLISQSRDSKRLDMVEKRLSDMEALPMTDSESTRFDNELRELKKDMDDLKSNFNPRKVKF